MGEGVSNYETCIYISNTLKLDYIPNVTFK